MAADLAGITIPAWLDIGSGALGLLGSVFLAIPFFSDYRERRDRARALEEIALAYAAPPPADITPEELQKLREAKIANLTDSLLDPNLSDAVKSLVGILLLLVSFGLLLVKSLVFAEPP